MDSAEWHSTEDFWMSFFAAVKAPSWHGRNFNALRDSIATGDINGIEVPYRIVFINYRLVSTDVKPLADNFTDLITELDNEGVKVSIRIEM
jgi:RNAse (barnase) inhibitor barstar